MDEVLLGTTVALVALRPSPVATTLSGMLVGLAAGLLLVPAARPGGRGRVVPPAVRGGPARGTRPRRATSRSASAIRRSAASSRLDGAAAPESASGSSSDPAPCTASDPVPGAVSDAALMVDLVSSLLAAGSGIEASLDRLARTVPGAEPLSTVHRALAAGSGWEEAWDELRRGRGGSPGGRGLGPGRGRRDGRRRRCPDGRLGGRAVVGLGGLLGRLVRRRREDARLSALRDLGEQLTFAHGTGAPSTELLQIGAARLRAARRHAAERQVARLGVRMVLPLGLCFLPAFILLGVMPVVLGLLPQVIDGALGG